MFCQCIKNTISTITMSTTPQKASTWPSVSLPTITTKKSYWTPQLASFNSLPISGAKVKALKNMLNEKSFQAISAPKMNLG